MAMPCTAVSRLNMPGMLDTLGCMRLPPDSVQAIRNAVQAEAGDAAEVYLFGSRLDDAARGGDVDLYIESPGIFSPLRKAALKLRLEELLGLPVDLVVAQKDIAPTPFQRIARRTGVRL